MKETKNGNKFWEPDLKQIMKGFPMKVEMRNCIFCGFKHEFKKEKCPAWGKTCHICNGRNHFKSKCKKVHCIENEKKLTLMMSFG